MTRDLRIVTILRVRGKTRVYLTQMVYNRGKRCAIAEKDLTKVFVRKKPFHLDPRLYLFCYKYADDAPRADALSRENIFRVILFLIFSFSRSHIIQEILAPRC